MKLKYKTPPWKRGLELPSYPQLKEDIETDILVIGGGIAGLLTAYELVSRGFSVIVAEKETMLSGATAYTTAFLTQSIDTDARDLIKMHGEEDARLILESHQKAIDRIEEIVTAESIDCDFVRCPDYIYAESPDDAHVLKEEYEALVKLGVDAHLNMAGDDELGFSHFAYIEICNQAKFHPLRFASALAEIIAQKSGQIFEHTEVLSVRTKEDKRIAETKKGEVAATWIVSATYEPFNEPLQLFFKKGMYVSYVMEMEIEKERLGEGIYEDTHNPYHYFRIDPEDTFDRMIIGGEDNKEIFPVDEDKHFAALEEYVTKKFPGLEYQIVCRWSGPILEPSDGLAFIGPSKDPHMVYMFGFSGNGMTYSGISAMMIADIIEGKNNPYYPIYKASRWMDLKDLAMKAKDYTEEFIQGAAKDAFKKKK